LFQTGYLTIKKKEMKENGSIYTIDLPNLKVEKSFLMSLLKEYTYKDAKGVQDLRNNLSKKLIEKDATGLKELLRQIYAGIPYDLHTPRESFYHALFIRWQRQVDMK
jgi:hypothetical protein